MSRERMLQIGVIAVLLITGMLVGWNFRAAVEDTVPAAASNVFREWFWEHRSLDLLVQVTLIFVGALGVAAVLPRYNEPHSTIEPFKGVQAGSRKSSKDWERDKTDDELTLD